MMCFSISCRSQNDGRKIIQELRNPSGKIIAVVDEVEYANGLLTSVADRVCLLGDKWKKVDGIVVFSSDAMPLAKKPTIAWESNKLIITISADATDVHYDKQVDEFEIELKTR